ncbi:MAG TPA: tetratricopeptide repeat protein, partial [Acidobacteriota bacterium]|nr:tetratricopeptide repeat protein [Acidobacteriota bacterium]
MPKTFFLWLILWIVLPVGNQNTLAQTQTDQENPADSILKKARELRAQNQTSELHAALACYETLLGQPRLTFPPDEQAQIYFEVGQLYFQIGNQSQAIDRLSRAADIYQSTNDLLNQARIINYIGAAYLNQGNPERASEYFRQSVERCRQVNSPEGLAVSLSNLGTAKIQLNEYAGAEQAFLEVLALRESTGDQVGQAMTLYNLARLYENQGLESKANEAYVRASGFFQTRTTPSLAKAAIFSGFGVFLVNQEKYTEGLQYLEVAAELFRSAGELNGQIIVLTAQGSIALSRGQYQKALDLGYEAMEIARQIGNIEALQTCEHLLGNCYLWYS